jgi:hypothetical protein
MILIPDYLECLATRMDTRLFHNDSLELIQTGFNDTSDPLSDGCEHEKATTSWKALVDHKCA